MSNVELFTGNKFPMAVAPLRPIHYFLSWGRGKRLMLRAPPCTPGRRRGAALASSEVSEGERARAFLDAGFLARVQGV